MMQNSVVVTRNTVFGLLGLAVLLLAGCSTAYYGAMEKVGVHKRDIMISRVEKARDSQTDAQEQFKTALERFDAVVKLKETDLKQAYDNLNSEYESSEEAATEVSNRIDAVEDVADALFAEWEEELTQYSNNELRRSSQKKLQETRKRYKTMVTAMHKAEAGMEPVLRIFHDNVLYLKHNLNAQAIGSLKGEFAGLQSEIRTLMARMNDSIASSNTFIAGLK